MQSQATLVDTTLRSAQEDFKNPSASAGGVCQTYKIVDIKTRFPLINNPVSEAFFVVQTVSLRAQRHNLTDHATKVTARVYNNVLDVPRP